MVPVVKVSPFDIKCELFLQLGDIYGISALSLDNKQAKYMINTTCSTCGTESTYRFEAPEINPSLCSTSCCQAFSFLVCVLYAEVPL